VLGAQRGIAPLEISPLEPRARSRSSAPVALNLGSPLRRSFLASSSSSVHLLVAPWPLFTVIISRPPALHRCIRGPVGPQTRTQLPLLQPSTALHMVHEQTQLGHRKASAARLSLLPTDTTKSPTSEATSTAYTTLDRLLRRKTQLTPPRLAATCQRDIHGKNHPPANI
jgi:hypothetical protein